MTPLALHDTLAGAAHASGGWPYAPGKAPRVEPTCWTVLALQASSQRAAPAAALHAAFLARCRQPSGLLAEHRDIVPNLAFNGMAALVALTVDLMDVASRTQLFAAIGNAAGIRLEPSPHFTQDNSLRGWPWVADTFSWVEPTAWCALALKKRRALVRAGRLPQPRTPSAAVLDARIHEADMLLLDRACPGGGWNYGNGTAFGQALPAHLPTTALALMALQDRRDQPAVARGVTFLREQSRRERSKMALGLTTVCLHVLGEDHTEPQHRLATRAGEGEPSPNLCATAIALYALSTEDHDASAFRL